MTQPAQPEFRVIKSTTDKLERELNDAFEDGYLEVVAVTFTGGRDWVAVVRLGEE